MMAANDSGVVVTDKLKSSVIMKCQYPPSGINY